MWAPFSWTLSKPCVLSRIFGMFWIASLSWMILPPPQGLKIVIVPEFAPFFADRVCRVASVSRCRLHWTFLCVPLCRRLSPNTLSKFRLCSGSTVSTSHAHVFGQVETTEPESTIRAIISACARRMELRMCRSAIASLLVVRAKMKVRSSLVCSPTQTTRCLSRQIVPGTAVSHQNIHFHLFLDL